MSAIGMDGHRNEYTSLLGQVIKAFGRCRCIGYLKLQGFGYNIKECDAIRQRLKYNCSGSSNTSMKRSSDGIVTIQNKCFNCGDIDHFIKDCPLPKQRK